MIKKFFPLAMILALIFLLFTAFPSSVSADHLGDWGYIKISPLSGHWNYPGYFVLEAEQPVTVEWEIKCSYVPCGRPAEFGSHTFTEVGEKIQVGWGHQCYAWQFDPIGRTGFIAEAEPDLCNEVTPTPTATEPIVTPTASPTGTPQTPTGTPATPTSTPETPTGTPPTPTSTPETPTGTPPTPTDTPATPTGTPPTPTVTVESPGGTPTDTPVGGVTPTPDATPDPPAPSPTQELLLPATGELPPASPLSSPLWPSLAALLLLTLAGRMVWTGVLQSENAQIPANLDPGLRSQARKALILILVSLLILAFLVLPAMVRQVSLEFGGNNSDSQSAPALVQEISPNFSLAPGGQAPSLEIMTAPQTLDKQLTKISQSHSSGERNSPALASFGVHQIDHSVDTSPVTRFLPLSSVERISSVQVFSGEKQGELWVDTSPVTRLVIPSLSVDSKVHYVPFKDKTWDIQGLGMDIAWLGDTPGPGLGSNTVLAGHITALYLGNGPFRYLNRLKPGDLVHVYTAGNIYTYSVREQAVVKPNDASVIGPTGRTQLTLLTCTGWDDEARQYINRRAVFADLVSEATASVNNVKKWE